MWIWSDEVWILDCWLTGRENSTRIGWHRDFDISFFKCDVGEFPFWEISPPRDHFCYSFLPLVSYDGLCSLSWPRKNQIWKNFLAFWKCIKSFAEHESPPLLFLPFRKCKNLWTLATLTSSQNHTFDFSSILKIQKSLNLGNSTTRHPFLLLPQPNFPISHRIFARHYYENSISIMRAIKQTAYDMERNSLFVWKMIIV